MKLFFRGNEIVVGGLDDDPELVHFLDHSEVSRRIDKARAEGVEGTDEEILCSFFGYGRLSKELS